MNADDNTSASKTDPCPLQGAKLVGNVQAGDTGEVGVNTQTTNTADNKDVHHITGDEWRYPTADESPTPDQSALVSVSYEAFEGEFLAEDFIHRATRDFGQTGKDDVKEEDESTCDDVTTIREFEETENLTSGSQTDRCSSDMPQRVASKPEHRFQPENTFFEHVEKNRRPKSAGTRRRHNSANHPSAPSDDEAANQTDDIRAVLSACKKSSLKKYNSTGDLSNAGRMSPATRKRLLPDLATCKRLSRDDAGSEFSSSEEDLRMPETPGDRPTLEAQFKLLYRENVKLDRAYGELQDKVRSESPRILSARYLSPRELQWQAEKKELKREIKQVKEELDGLKTFHSHEDVSKASGSLSPPSEKTELYLKEKLQTLTDVKDGEITRLSNQLVYWVDQVKHNNEQTDRHKERIADLEQSEALLRCKIINLEEQLATSQKQQSTKDLQIKDLGDHCKKLEDSLAVIDAEKALLDDLKRENGNIRNKLASSENDNNVLVGKLAQLAEQNASLDMKLSGQNKSDSTQQEKLKKSGDEISTLKNECTALSDRCSALEVVKTCLTEQIRSMEDELNNETNEANEKVKKLNQKIRSLQSEKSDLTEYKEKYESEQELNANMTEKLTKRISDLQDHIETLKSQLDNQKHKVSSFDKLQEQLEVAISEKCSMEAALQRQRAEKQKLEAKMSDQQEQLSESFERANEQLMLETNEMATRQRSLLAEVQALRIKSSLRGVDARIGADLRQRLGVIVEQCRETLRSIQASRPKSEQRGVSPVPTLALGDLAATPRTPFSADFTVDLQAAELSERELDEILSRTAKSVDGLTSEELYELQNDSPRLEGVGRLEDLRRCAGECHVIVETLACASNAFVHLCSQEIESQREIEDLIRENDDLRKRQNHGQESEPCEANETSNEAKQLSEDLRVANESLRKKKIQMVQSEEENNKLKCLVRQEEEKCRVFELERDKIKSDFDLSKQVEEELKSQLSDTQDICDQLVSRMQKVQEEKAELIMSQQKVHSDSGQAELEELRESLHKLQHENSALRAKLKEERSKTESELSGRLEEIEDLRVKLDESQKAEANLRKSLDETQLAGEELIKRVQVIQEEKFKMLEQNKIETEDLRKLLASRDDSLQSLEEEKSALTEKNLKLMKDIENLEEGNENHMEMLLANDATIADLQHSLDQAEKEVVELNGRMEMMKKDGKTADAAEISELKEKLEGLNKALKQSNEQSEHNERLREQLQCDVDQSAETFKVYKEQTEATTTAFEQEIETLRFSNEQLTEEANSANAKLETAAEKSTATEEEKEERAISLEQQIETQEQETKGLQELLTSAEKKIESISEELNDKLIAFAELQSSYDGIVKSLEESESENRSLERIIEKLQSMQGEEDRNIIQGSDEEEQKKLKDELSHANEQLRETENRIHSLEEEISRLQEEVAKLLETSQLRHESCDQAIQCLMTRDEPADKLSTSDYQSNALTGEVEWETEQRSKFEGDVVAPGKQLSIPPEQQTVAARTSSYAQASDVSGSNKTMEDLIDFDSEVDAVVEVSPPEASPFCSSDEPSLVSAGNPSATESNQLLLEPAVQQIGPCEKQCTDSKEEPMLKFREDNYVQKLRQDNERLAAMLRVAQENADGKEALQDQMLEYQKMVSDLRAKLNEAENHIQSGTESDPEAILQERRTQHEEDKREIERLCAQLLDADCTIVACKNKIEYEEKVINDLRVAIDGLHSECDKYKKKRKLPDHPAIENAMMHLRQKRLTTSSPASLASQLRPNSASAACSLSERETLPFDEVLAYLCDDYADGKEEIERLTTELEDSKDLLQSLKKRNQDLEREALDLEEKLQETHRNLAVKEDEWSETQKLLTMNEANSKESLRSKEEDIEKLEERIQSLNFDIKEKVQEVRRLEEKTETTDEQHDAKISQMEKKLMNITVAMDRKAEENEILASETRELKRTNHEIKLLLEKKDEEMKTMREERQKEEEDLRESLNSLQDKYTEKCDDEIALNKTLHFRQNEIDQLKEAARNLEETENQLKASLQLNEQSLSNLNNQLSDREERIETLSARLDKLQETEGALRSTMESADEIIAEREQRHQEEVEELKDGLNKTLSEANRAKMSSEELQEEIILLEEKNKSLENEIEEMRKEERDCANDMETLEMERELMNTSLNNAREETQEARDKSNDLALTVDELNDIIDEMQATIDQLNAQVVALRGECDQLTSDAQQEKMEAAELREDNQVLREQLQKLRSSISTESATPHAQRPVETANGEQTERLEEEICLLREGLAQAQKLIHSLRIDKEHLEQEVTRMQTDSARGSLQWTDGAADNTYDVSDRDVSTMHSEEVKIPEERKIQEDSISLRSENEALRCKIASLEDSLNEMTERLVPKLELGSIAESEPKQQHDDDTGRYLDDCDVDTARVIDHEEVVESLKEKLRASEDAATKLLLQVQEMEEESGSLRERVQELAKQNDDMQSEFFGAIHDNFQTQIDELTTDNEKLQEELTNKEKELEETKSQMQQTSGSENQWRLRYQDVQKMAEELRSRLQRTEKDNHELQCRLIDLDQECQKMMNQVEPAISERSHASIDATDMKPKSCDACAQTLSLDDVIREVREARKARKIQQIPTNGIDDTENEVSDIDSHSNGSAQNLAAELLVISETQGGAKEADGLANDPLLQRSIIREKVAPEEVKFNEADIPLPVTQNGDVGGTRSPDSEPPSISIATKIGATLGDQIKSLQSEILGYQLMIEKLKKRNQELLDGAGAAMTQDDKEAMEREISALRGQVALLERNNRIFSDRERTDLKQDLEMANKRCNNLQTQLLNIKKRMEYEEMEKLQRECDKFKAEVDKLREQLQEYEDDKAGSGSETSGSNQGEKYARLLELEEEAEELQNKIKEKEEDVKDRDVMVEELQHQLENVRKQHQEEARKLEKKNKDRENEMIEEIRDLEKQVEDCQEMMELKQANLKNKCDELEESEYEIEKLQKDIQKKSKEIEKLKWDIESLQRENASLRERIDNLRQALNDVNEYPTSPPTSFRSPSNVSMQFRSRSSSRSSNPVTSPKRKSELSNRSTESIGSSPAHVRATSSGDEDSSGKRTKSPLRTGIESAKRKVHDIGDVLDTPRAAATPRSSTSKESSWSHPEQHPDREDIGTDAMPLNRGDDSDSSLSSSSSLEISKIGRERPQSLSLSLPTENHAQKGSHSDREDMRKAVNDRKGPFTPNKSKISQKSELEHSEARAEVPEQNRQTKPKNGDHIKEDIVSVLSVPSNNATLETSLPLDRQRLSSSEEGVLPVNRKTPPASSKLIGDGGTSDDEASTSSKSSASTFRQSRKNYSEKPDYNGEDVAPTSQQTAPATKPVKTVKETGNAFKPNVQGSENRAPLLPDDRPTLIQEVTKARDEARKWFQEVTQSDREKRHISRRLAELESELERLKGIEDNYSALKKKQAEVENVTRDLETLRSQTSAANRKAEEARERSALLQAHLLDKEQVEAENAKLKENIETLKQGVEERKPSTTPLRELQPSSLDSSLNDLKPSPEKKSGEIPPRDVAMDPGIETQIRSIKDSFEYVANNFTSLVLKKHDAELALTPEKVKVSKLKRKCLERDQLLAKLVLKLRKKKQRDVSDDDSSVTSSVGLDNMLAKADSLIRSEVIDSDWSESDHVLPASRKDDRAKSNEFISSPRPSSALIRSLTEKPIKRPSTSPTHRIFVAKRDYAPSAAVDSDTTAPVTHALLPDLPVLAGDTVVAIGNPDKRGDGKLYQLAEVRGKIGFVPLAHLVAAEQVEGMQAFMQEKTKKRKSPSSSPEKIVDLYKKLEQAHLLVADKIDRASKSSKSSPGSRSMDSVTSDGNLGLSHSGHHDDVCRSEKKHSGDELAANFGSEASSLPRDRRRKAKPRLGELGHDSTKPLSKTHLDRSYKGSARSSNRSISPVLPVARDYGSDVRSSTPLMSPVKQARRSSSLPPRKSSSERPEVLTSTKRADRHQRRDRNRSRESGVERALAPPRVLSSPKSPTFVVIEKTMGQKSMIVSWTPPVLDMISRSNGIPVIGYEISIDGERRVQISGAYTNKAILGDLELSRSFLVEVRTVSSVGTLSRPAEVMYSPNSDFSSRYDPGASFDLSRASVAAHQKSKSEAASLLETSIKRATALYDYDPAVDSPYKSHDEEVGLNKGSPVLVLGSPRPDGFCDVQVGNKRGLAPIAFLISEDGETDSSSVTSSTRHKPRSSRPRTKNRRQQR